MNVIKNPEFVFDINKSATVDNCLSTVASAYIDACSTKEYPYSKVSNAVLFHIETVVRTLHFVRMHQLQNCSTLVK